MCVDIMINNTKFSVELVIKETLLKGLYKSNRVHGDITRINKGKGPYSKLSLSPIRK